MTLAKIWEKLESLYGDDEPLDEEMEVYDLASITVACVQQMQLNPPKNGDGWPQEEEFDDLVRHLNDLEAKHEAASTLMDKQEITQRGLRHLALALEEGAAGAPVKKKDT